MRPSKDLIELIHALSQSEKRYFKVFAAKRRGKDNVYIRLFDAIDAQKVYDEKALREKFNNEPFVRQLHVAKNYLYKVLLKSLAAYHSKISMNAQLQEMLGFIEVLYEKGFYGQCEKLIKKGKQLCRQYEKYLILAQFCEWEGKVLLRKSKFAQMHACSVEQQFCLENAQNILYFKQKAFNMYDKVVKMGVVRNRAQRKELYRLVHDPVLKRNMALQPNELLYYKYSIFSLYASAIGNHRKHFNYTMKIFEIFERNKNFREEFPYHYISSVNNLCNALIYLNKSEEVIPLVQKMREFCTSSLVNKREGASVTGLLLSFDLEIIAYLNTQQFQKIISLTKPVEELLTLHGKKLQESNLLDLIYDMAYGLFLAKDYDRSLTWLLKIIHENRLSTRYDIYEASRILLLVLHYEMKHEALLRNIIKPTLKFLDKKKRLHLPEKIFLRFLDSLLRLKDNSQRTAAFKKLRKEIQAALKNPMEQRVLQYFDIPAWIDSKILNKDLSIILKEKTKNKKDET
ncbi:MAG: hypothetical protein KatS3mg031_3012 [Chitinophagales bacterium]|nr:MAG: hypothetical protein KatS3mg031_3012 [Chitinophagales bacterium]